MKREWNEEHGKVLMSLIKKLEANKIKYFVLRGYEGLPSQNYSKDVDIMVENGYEKKASKLLIETFKEAGFDYYYKVVFGHANCYVAMSLEKEMSIHIDLIDGYVSKGYEVVTFEEMYRHIIRYNEINVLDKYMNGIMLLIYKIFGYKSPKLKKEYRKEISQAYNLDKLKFEEFIKKIAGDKVGSEIIEAISKEDYEKIIEIEPCFTKVLKKHTIRCRFFKTLKYRVEFFWQKFSRIILFYRKYSKTIAVLAPDGTGKTTFLENLVENINFYFVNDKEDKRVSLYHFRPSIMPNLGKIGEKAGVMKQDTNFTNPHRNKPANVFSSFIRCGYYILDYIIGWQKCVRYDVKFDKFTVFDRYSYDFIVDPLRSKLNLPKVIRKFFVSLTPKPSIVFVLKADYETIYSRKQELTKEEIKRQLGEYSLISKNKKRFVVIDAEKTPEKMAKEAMKIVLEKFTKKLERN